MENKYQALGSNLFMAIALIALGVTIILSMVSQWLS